MLAPVIQTLTRKFTSTGVASIAICLSLSALPANAEGELDKSARLTDDNVALIYHQISGESAPVADMIIKPENKRFENEFEKRRFVKEAWPAFEQRAKDALAHDAYYVQFNTRLGDYDFDKEQFPVAGIYSSYMYFDYDADDAGSDGLDYAVQIVNPGDVKFLKMSPDEAEALMGRLGSDRAIKVRMWLVPIQPVEAGWVKLKDDIFRTFNTQATRVEVMDRDANFIAEIDSGIKAVNAVKPVSDNPIKMPDFSNPWSAENRSEALLDYYDWVVTEQYKLSSSGNGKSFEEAMSLRGAAASGCTAKFGYSQCMRLSEARSHVIDQCASEIKPPRTPQCYKLQYVPYSSNEADAD